MIKVVHVTSVGLG